MIINTNFPVFSKYKNEDVKIIVRTKITIIFFILRVSFSYYCQRYNKNSNGLKCSYFEVIKVTQFFEFFQFKNNKAKFEKFCGLRFA